MPYKNRFAYCFLFFSAISSCTINFAQEKLTPVSVKVDLSADRGAMKPIWAWFGYDEPNYTYMKDGKKLLSEIAALSPVPVYVRAHTACCAPAMVPPH